MIKKKWLRLFWSAVLGISLAWAGVAAAQQKVLYVYGPGGPLGPMQECGQMFSKEHRMEVRVTGGPTPKWIESARQNADLIFGGAECMLTEFMLKHPDLVDPRTRTSLYDRPLGILVRPGNPKKIISLTDLTKDGVRIVVVNGAGQMGLWEDLAGVLGLIPSIQQNILLSVVTSTEAVEKWKTMPELDAWITYESWHYPLEEITELVRLPRAQRLYRSTPIAITSISKQSDLAQQFIDFLKTSEAHAVFQKWGWR